MFVELSSVSRSEHLSPRIVIVGVGGAGCNAINNMIECKLQGVEFVAMNTDSQSLQSSRASRTLQLGSLSTEGLGAGSKPDVGRRSAEESEQEIRDALEECNMLFLTAGMGGGTGTGATPVIAGIAKSMGILTVAVVTKPFAFEGYKRMAVADSGIAELQDDVGTLLVIPNQNLFRLANERTTLSDAFSMADDVLYSGVRGITDLITVEGLINLDFADIRTVMSEMGQVMMGSGEAEGEKRALKAATMAMANPLLDDTDIQGAREVLVNVTAGRDVTLFEVDEAINSIRSEVGDDANFHFGAAFDDGMEGKIRVSVVATGIGSDVSYQANLGLTGMRRKSLRGGSESGMGGGDDSDIAVLSSSGEFAESRAAESRAAESRVSSSGLGNKVVDNSGFSESFSSGNVGSVFIPQTVISSLDGLAEDNFIPPSMTRADSFSSGDSVSSSGDGVGDDKVNDKVNDSVDVLGDGDDGNDGESSRGIFNFWRRGSGSVDKPILLDKGDKGDEGGGLSKLDSGLDSGDGGVDDEVKVDKGDRVDKGDESDEGKTVDDSDDGDLLKIPAFLRRE